VPLHVVVGVDSGGGGGALGSCPWWVIGMVCEVGSLGSGCIGAAGELTTKGNGCTLGV